MGQQQQQQQQQQPLFPPVDFEGEPGNSLACCFFVDLNEKKKTPSCKKIADAFGSGAKVQRFKESGNVKSASLPSVYPDEAAKNKTVKSDAGKNTAPINDAGANAGAATAWEIPSGKKRKQKVKQRRNTQTITMEGAQVDSSQLYQAVCSYNPILFSHSGRSTEELSLVEGNVVKPLTGVDATGYLYAQVCGNKGLVPAAYLIPLNKAASAASTEAAAEAAAFGHDHVIHRDNNKTNCNENNNDNNQLAASDNNKNDADVTHQSAQRNNNKDNKDNKDMA